MLQYVVILLLLIVMGQHFGISETIIYDKSNLKSLVTCFNLQATLLHHHHQHHRHRLYSQYNFCLHIVLYTYNLYANMLQIEIETRRVK